MLGAPFELAAASGGTATVPASAVSSSAAVAASAAEAAAAGGAAGPAAAGHLHTPALETCSNPAFMVILDLQQLCGRWRGQNSVHDGAVAAQPRPHTEHA